MQRAFLHSIAGAAIVLRLFSPGHIQAQATATGGDEAVEAPLFASTGLVEFTVETDLKTLLNDRDSVKSKYHPAKFTYSEPDGTPTTINIEVKTRGHWRRQKKNCDFPPLRLDFPRKKLEGTLFEEQNKLKLVTPCKKKNNDYEQYVLREYLAYRAYNLMTPWSLRARLARTTYIDVKGKEDTLTKYTFVIEDEDQMAERNGGTLLDVRGARFDDVEPNQFALVGSFFYMIGATDWSLIGLHNVVLVQDRKTGTVYPVAYDFDWTGIVDARYSFPDHRLPIKSVRDRLYRANCRTAEQWEPILAKFRGHKEAIYALYTDQPGLDERSIKRTHEYLDDFYRTIDNEGRMKGELVGPCRTCEM